MKYMGNYKQEETKKVHICVTFVPRMHSTRNKCDKLEKLQLWEKSKLHTLTLPCFCVNRGNKDSSGTYSTGGKNHGMYSHPFSSFTDLL